MAPGVLIRITAHVWVPRVAVGWAPYRDGHWAWISPWGWTWIDDAPWGYAPFHYGRWVNFGGNWGWVPGPIAVRPVYAPALVVFIGGPQVSEFAISSWWRRWRATWDGSRWAREKSMCPRTTPAVRTSTASTSPTRPSTTRRSQTSTIPKSTTPKSITRASQTFDMLIGAFQAGVTAVSQSAFTSAQPVAKAAVTMNAQQIASAPVSSRAAVAPTKNSVFGTSASSGNARIARPPAAVATRSVVAKTPPPPPPVHLKSNSSHSRRTPASRWQGMKSRVCVRRTFRHRNLLSVKRLQAGLDK